MNLNLKKGAQILHQFGRKIADLDAPSASTPPATTTAEPATTTTAEAAQPPTPRDDWGVLLVKLLAAAPEDVSMKLISCLDKDVLVKALRDKEDPYLKVALLLLKK